MINRASRKLLTSCLLVAQLPKSQAVRAPDLTSLGSGLETYRSLVSLVRWACHSGLFKFSRTGSPLSRAEARDIDEELSEAQSGCAQAKQVRGAVHKLKRFEMPSAHRYSGMSCHNTTNTFRINKRIPVSIGIGIFFPYP